MEISPFAYNETVAHEYYPLSKAEVEQLGLRWREPDDTEIPQTAKNALTCAESARVYKLVPQEVKFYQKMGLSPPSICPQLRHKRRMTTVDPALARWSD